MFGGKARSAVLAVLAVLSLVACGDMHSDTSATPMDASLANRAENSKATVDNGQEGETVNVGVVSWRDLPFQTVKHQSFDYSCGSAAVATLMTYAYGHPVSEKDVFEKMFAQGDKDKIRREGFSMLDMSRYLNGNGLDAKGYKITEKVIADHKLPVIALVNNNGYNHFVVVKTIKENRVLVGDPNTGNTEYSQDDFAKIWNGIALVVTNEVDKARTAYNDEKEWHFVRAHAPVRDGNDTSIMSADLAAGNWQIAPVIPNMLPMAAVGASVSPAVGGGL